MKLKLLDFISIIFVLLLAIGCALPMLLADGGTVVIASDSGEERCTLADDREISVVSGGHALTVKIEDGKASVMSSDCPDGLCMASPAISRGGETIVCLPAQVVIRIDGESSGGDMDGVVG